MSETPTPAASTEDMMVVYERIEAVQAAVDASYIRTLAAAMEVCDGPKSVPVVAHLRAIADRLDDSSPPRPEQNDGR